MADVNKDPLYVKKLFPLVNGGLSEWSAWTSCTETCGTGMRTRTKTCKNPSPQYGGNDCTGLGDTQQEEDCNTLNCPSKVYSHPYFLTVQRRPFQYTWFKSSKIQGSIDFQGGSTGVSKTSKFNFWLKK